MEKEDGVCNWELAKRLKELGEKQKCLWYWQYNGKNHFLPEYTLECGRGYGISKKDCYAPTVAELGERLPVGCKSWLMHGEPIYVNGDHITGHWTGRYKRGKWICTYKEKKCEAKTEADVRTKMRIYLLENKLIEEG